MQVDGKGGMQCGRLEDLGSLQITTSSLPDNTAVLMVQVSLFFGDFDS